MSQVKVFVSTAVLGFPAGIYLLKVNNRNTRTKCEICSKLTVKISASFWYFYCWLWTYFTHCSSVSIVNFEHVFAGWIRDGKVMLSEPTNFAIISEWCSICIFYNKHIISNWWNISKKATELHYVTRVLGEMASMLFGSPSMSLFLEFFQFWKKQYNYNFLHIIFSNRR